MVPSLKRFRLAAALGVLGAAAAVGCDRASDGRSVADARTTGQAAVAPAGGQYDPAITVYKNPT